MGQVRQSDKALAKGGCCSIASTISALMTLRCTAIVMMSATGSCGAWGGQAGVWAGKSRGAMSQCKQQSPAQP